MLYWFSAPRHKILCWDAFLPLLKPLFPSAFMSSAPISKVRFRRAGHSEGGSSAGGKIAGERRLKNPSHVHNSRQRSARRSPLRKAHKPHYEYRWLRGVRNGGGGNSGWLVAGRNGYHGE